MPLPAELENEVDYDAVAEQQKSDVEKALDAHDSASIRDTAGGSFFSRDYIPTDPAQQTEAQRKFLQTVQRQSREEGPRDYIPTTEAPEDRSFEEKIETANKAAQRWVDGYDVLIKERAEQAAQEMPEAQFISLVRAMGQHEKNIYIRAELANKNRPYVISQLGMPDDTPVKAQPDVPTIPAPFVGPSGEDEEIVAEETYKPSEDVNEVDDEAEHAEDGLLVVEGTEPDSPLGGEQPSAAVSPASEEVTTVLPDEGEADLDEGDEE